MQWRALPIALALCFSGCAASETRLAAQAPAESAPHQACQDARPGGLDGLVAPGRIRARGVIGIISVRGALSFRDGMLVWAVGESEDSGPYALSGADCSFRFTAEHTTADNEHVLWTGFSDGRTVTDVTAVWTRIEGDFVHDLLLPEQVTLDFTPDR